MLANSWIKLQTTVLVTFHGSKNGTTGCWWKYTEWTKAIKKTLTLQATPVSQSVAEPDECSPSPVPNVFLKEKF
jgi:hypothetical protein